MTRLIGVLIILALITWATYWMYFSDEHTVTATVYDVEKITNTHGDKDGFNTEVYYLLSTDHGTYHIGIDGLFAHPEYAKAIQPDSLYQITVIGKSFPFCGIYPRVKHLNKANTIWK